MTDAKKAKKDEEKNGDGAEDDEEADGEEDDFEGEDEEYDLPYGEDDLEGEGKYRARFERTQWLTELV